METARAARGGGVSLDVSKLTKARKLGNVTQAQCPACAESGLDKSGNHLRIFADGRFGCALQPKDKIHNKRIWELARPEKSEKAVPYVFPVKTKPEPRIDAAGMADRWRAATPSAALAELAASLGVKTGALKSLGVGWAPGHKGWSFPMSDARGKVVGIRLRSDDGRKWAVTGSKQGLFIPHGQPDRVLHVAEGPTDTAALLSIGIYAVGRPSCMGCADTVCEFVELHGIQRVVIVSDHDSPGQQGAVKLQAALSVPSMTYTPPGKDIREAVKCGLSAEMLESMTRDLIWFQPDRNYERLR